MLVALADAATARATPGGEAVEARQQQEHEKLGRSRCVARDVFPAGARAVAEGDGGRGPGGTVA